MAQPSSLQAAVETIVSVFHEHASKGGDKLTLSKGELKALLQEHFKEVLGDTSDQEKLDEIFRDLDMDMDGKVDFQEFFTLILTLSMILNHFVGQMSQ